MVVPRHPVQAVGLPISQPALSGAPALSWPAYGAAAVGADGYGVLASHGQMTALPTASTTKILTALTVLAKHPLSFGEQGPLITMTQHDADLYKYYFSRNGSVLPVAAGQQLTEYQALQALLLRSANNMADTLAIWAYGSMSSFTDAANLFAGTLGLANYTVGRDASGFDPTTTATATNMVRLGIAGMKQPVIAEIVGQKSAIIPGVGPIFNTNSLLGQHGIIGIKTGNNDQDKGVYLFAANVQPPGGEHTELVGAIMGAPNINQAKADAVPLLISAQKGFAPRVVVRAGQTVGRYTSPWGASSDVVAQQTITVVGWQNRSPAVRTTFRAMDTPFSAGTSVGSLSARSANGQLQSVGLVVTSPMNRPPLSWRLLHPLQ